MKARKQNKNEKKILGVTVKPSRVNVIRLTKEYIDRMINVPEEQNVVNYNFTLKHESNKWVCTDHPKSIIPKISSGNILISLRHNNPASDGIPSTAGSLTSSKNVKPNNYQLRFRAEKTETSSIKKIKPVLAVAEIGTTTQKNKLWAACKRSLDKTALGIDSFVFAKQTGYAPWPSKIVSINKSGKSAIVQYYGFNNYIGSAKMDEIVQVNNKSKDAISALVVFTLRTKAIKEFARFEKAMKEVEGAMKSI